MSDDGSLIALLVLAVGNLVQILVRVIPALTVPRTAPRTDPDPGIVKVCPEHGKLLASIERIEGIAQATALDVRFLKEYQEGRILR